MSDSSQWVFFANDELAEPPEQLVQLLGNKGVSLRRLRSAEVSVPEWCTISTRACQHYLHNHAWPEGLEEQLQSCIARLEVVSGKTFGRAPHPLLLAVRSGAAVSMPGAMDTLLNCGYSPDLIRALPAESQASAWRQYAAFIHDYAASRNQIQLTSVGELESEPQDVCRNLMDEYGRRTGSAFPNDAWDALRESIIAVWKSFAGERARAFRNWLEDAHALTGTAVTVQVMSQACAAGVMFTRTSDASRGEVLVIEATSGSGRRLVSGEITPHRYVFSLNGGRLEELEIKSPREEADSLPLSAAQAAELAEIGCGLEQHFGAPLDLEWGREDGAWVFFQARTVINDERQSRIRELRQNEIERLRRVANGKPRIWMRHPLSESLPAPTPLTWDLFSHFMSGDGGYGRMYRRLGYSPSRLVCEHGLVELIAGRPYVEPDRVSELFAAGWPFGYAVAELVSDDSLLDRAPAHLDESRIDESFLLRLPRLLWIIARARWKSARLARRVRDDFEQRELPAWRDYIRQEQDRDLRGLDYRQLLELFHARCARVLDDFGAASLLPGLFGGLSFAALERDLVMILGDFEGRQLARDLVSGLESEHVTLRDEMLYQLSQGEIPLESFLEEFGHRAINELELAVPRWREDPSTVVQLAAWLRDHDAADPAQQRERARQQRLRKSAELVERIQDAGGRSFLANIQAHLWHASELLPYREIGKHYFLLGYELLRQVLCEMAPRVGLQDEIFFCRLQELNGLDTTPISDFRATLLARRRDWQLMQRLEVPDVVHSEQLGNWSASQRERTRAHQSFPATVLSPGMARGPALIVNDFREAGMRGGGYVLICHSLDPGLTPLLTAAKGLVVQRGGTLSHGAVVARQLGVPALACPDALAQIRNGDLLLLDGEQSMLHIERSRNNG